MADPHVHRGAPALSDSFLLWKTAHVLSAAVLFGSGLGIAFFCWVGYRSAVSKGDLGALRTTLRLTVLADLYLTAPAVLFQAASGVLLMNLLEWPLTSAWSIAVWTMFVAIGACWLPVVAIQIQLSRMAAAASSVDSLSEAFHRKFRVWFALGVPAFTLTVVVYYLMVAKPLAVA
jgi:uncharacterized membrane protein